VSNWRSSWRIAGLLAFVALAWAARADADPGTLRLDGDFVAASPAALPTGLSLGAGAGVTLGAGVFDLGVRASWSTATEYTLDWTVRQDDLRLRATAGLSHDAGRGSLFLRLGVGPTLVHEDRTRDQGSRAGLTGDALDATSWSALPAADVEGGVVLHLFDAWSFAVTGGPSLEILDGGLHVGWLGSVGVSWHG
jgi:hypothetical protein